MLLISHRNSVEKIRQEIMMELRTKSQKKYENLNKRQSMLDNINLSILSEGKEESVEQKRLKYRMLRQKSRSLSRTHSEMLRLQNTENRIKKDMKERRNSNSVKNDKMNTKKYSKRNSY